MRRSRILSFLWILGVLLTAPIGASEADDGGTTSPEPTNPMAPFARLVGGEWHGEGHGEGHAKGMYHRFEWGIGRHTVISHSYAVGEEGDTLVSEARWFWHPGRQALKGYAVDNQGKSFMEMATTFEGDKLINDLEWFQAGVEGVARYRGIWEFTDDDHYDWALYTETEDGPQKMMEASFSRKNRE